MAMAEGEGRREEHSRGRRRRPHMILFPCPLQGHINPMLQLATVLDSKGFSITIAHTRFNSPNPSNYTQLSFEPIDDCLREDEIAAKDVITLLSLLNDRCRAPFRDLLGRMVLRKKEDWPVVCIISDAIMHFTRAVAEEFKLKRMVLWTCSTSSFVAFAAFLPLREKGLIPITTDPRSEMPVVGLSYVRIKDLADIVTANQDTLHKLAINMVINGTKSSAGVICNSIDILEQPSLIKIQQDFQIPVFAIGPLHKYKSSFSSMLAQDCSCITWLDKQAIGSVIYVGFGSLASMNREELIETAWGLADSEVPFLWVIRPGSVLEMEWVELPKEFEKKTRARGKIVKWAPQEEVLAHPAIGGFWTHNGWNSTMESICEGVPMLCWPHFGDQGVNARYVSHVWKVGVQLENALERSEITRTIKQLMVGTEAEEMRKRIKVLKENANNCIKKGGSSYESLDRLTNYMLSL